MEYPAACSFRNGSSAEAWLECKLASALFLWSPAHEGMILSDDFDRDDQDGVAGGFGMMMVE
jgi:hypothetical protein